VDGVTGCLVERGDVDGLAEAIAALIAHPAKAREMGVAGSEWVRAHHAIDQYVGVLTDRYRVSLARRV
jgi:hypothetical protein